MSLASRARSFSAWRVVWPSATARGVGVRPRAVRRNSLSCAHSSSSEIAALTAGWLTPTWLATVGMWRERSSRQKISSRLLLSAAAGTLR